MSQLISAQMYATEVLNRASRTIAAIKIQKTWKMVCDDRLDKRQMIAIRNKGLNTLSSPIDWEEMNDTPKNHSDISFNGFSLTRSHSDNDKYIPAISCNGTDKEDAVLSSVISSWMNSFKKNEHFFQNHGKVWLDDPTKWEVLLTEIIRALYNTNMVVLWRDRGNQLRLYNKHIQSLEDLHLYWKLHLNLIKIDRLNKKMRELS